MSSQRRLALVTGATSGIGRATAVALGEAGLRVLVIGRDRERGEEVVRQLHSSEARFFEADFQSIASIRQLAETVLEGYQSLDVLVNNAGISPRDKQMTVDGLERTFEVNTLAPYLLTRLLIGPLTVARGRVVNVVTEVRPRTRIEIGDLKDPARHSTFSAYSRSKLALEMVTLEQARRYEGKLTVVGVNPGISFDTGLSAELPRRFVSVAPTLARMGRRRVLTPDEAGAQVARLATDAVSLPGQANDPAVRADLWAELERIAGAIDPG